MRVTVSGEIQDIDLDSRVGADAVSGDAVAHNLGLMLTLWHSGDSDADALNPVASKVYGAMYGATRPVRGAVVFTGAEDEQGRTRALAAGWEKNIRRVAEHMRGQHSLV